MIPELGPVFVSHRIQNILHRTKFAFIMSSCRASKFFGARRVLSPPPSSFVDLAQPFEVAAFFSGAVAAEKSLTLRYFFQLNTALSSFIPDAESKAMTTFSAKSHEGQARLVSGSMPAARSRAACRRNRAAIARQHKPDLPPTSTPVTSL